MTIMQFWTIIVWVLIFIAGWLIGQHWGRNAMKKFAKEMKEKYGSKHTDQK
jgi:hypothetical protein